MALRLLCTPEIYLYRAEIQYFLIGTRIFLPFFSLPKNLVVLNIHECLKPNLQNIPKSKTLFKENTLSDNLKYVYHKMQMSIFLCLFETQGQYNQ